MKEMSEEIPWGTVRYIDCLDPDEGLPSLGDKSISIGFVDPPWGVGMDKDKPRVYNAKVLKWDPTKTYFNDDFNPEWISVDVRGYNVLVEGEITHEFLPKSEIPEPATISLMGLSLLGLAIRKVRKN